MLKARRLCSRNAQRMSDQSRAVAIIVAISETALIIHDLMLVQKIIKIAQNPGARRDADELDPPGRDAGANQTMMKISLKQGAECAGLAAILPAALMKLDQPI